MISLGIDAVEINRFNNFKKYKQKQLEKLFTKNEIEYCLSNLVKSAERFAARFAAKEAFYKAISPLLGNPTDFLSLCKNIEVKKDISNSVYLNIDLAVFILKDNIEIKNTLLSITHSKNIAIAVVIIN